ncbi:MAG: hypothetical protein L6R39_000301 [Caloplaca ligustica]|nr:MAG: hypothetical protein L6R39_000301 [Caloplaca ligustica]
MLLSLTSLLLGGAALVTLVTAQVDTQLTGTWTTKSRKGLYDPVNEKMFEPPLTGFSYSFTDNGFYEVAYYRAGSNPQQPSCPKGIIQWQHGKYHKASNGSLVLNPFAVDGRQLMSDPCTYGNAVYTRYHQQEIFKQYEVLTNPYDKATRLNLYGWDGAPMNPMYLAYKPPQMLPTQTLNPTAGAATGGAQPSSTSKSKRDLHLAGDEDGLVQEALMRNNLRKDSTKANRLWWLGVGMTALGGRSDMCFRAFPQYADRPTFVSLIFLDSSNLRQQRPQLRPILLRSHYPPSFLRFIRHHEPERRPGHDTDADVHARPGREVAEGPAKIRVYELLDVPNKPGMGLGEDVLPEGHGPETY